MMAMLDPSHPGEIIREEIIAPQGLTVEATAEILGVTRQSLSTLLDERASLTPEMAIRIEKAFGTNADLLMRMQVAHDMAEARKHADQLRVERYQSR